MDGNSRITKASGSHAAWSRPQGQSSESAAPKQNTPSRLDSEGPPSRPPQHARSAAATARPRTARLHTSTASATQASGSSSIWKTITSIGSKRGAMPSHAARTQHPPANSPIDVASLNSEPGRLARSALQLALDRSGQTIELRLASPQNKPLQPVSQQPVERVVRLRHEAGTGFIVDTVRPNLPGQMVFRADGLGSSVGTSSTPLMDELSAQLHKVSGIGSFAVLSASINPPPRPASGLPGPSASTLTDQEKALVGVARWPDPAFNTERSKQQQAYGRQLWNTSREAGSEIAEGRIGSFLELWTYARDWRGGLAGDRDSKVFGLASARAATQRSDAENISPMTDQYRYIRDRYENRSGGVVQPSVRSGVFPDSIRFQAVDSINEQPIALTAMVMSTDPSADRDAPVYTAARKLGFAQYSEPFRIEYTGVPESERIMDHAETLYKRALDPAATKPQALETIAELHWWMSHGMPDQRGSAAKTELSVRSIAQARGIDLPPLQHGIVLDLEAMTTSRADFVKNYASYFSRPPDMRD